MGGEKKRMCHFSDFWCDYVVVSDLLEGLAPVVVRKPKPEPRDTIDIPPSNPDDTIDLESSPEHLLRKKVRKRKQTDAEAEGQPDKKVRRKKIPEGAILMPLPRTRFLPSSVVNEELLPSPTRVPVNEPLGSAEAPKNEAEKTVGAENTEVKKPTDVAVDVGKITSPEVVDVGAGRPQTPELAAQDAKKGKSAQEIPITTSPFAASSFMPENIEKNQGSFIRSNENSPIRPNETPRDYYYRCYTEKQADEVHISVWKLKKGDTFSN
ncbi:hypothetical protein Hdeb2414_s0143g00812171 [Helianthus debilis subsp. tardiflorus]